MFNFSRKKSLTAVAGMLFAFSSGAMAAPTVPETAPAFTEYVAAALSGKLKDTRIEVKNTLALSVGALSLDLRRLFAFCQNNRAECPAVLDNYAGGVGHVIALQNEPVKRESIRLVVRTDDYVRQARASVGDKAPALAVRPLADGLWSAAVLDTPRALRLLNHNDITKLKLSEDEVFALAGDNVTAELGPLSERARPVAKGQIGTLQNGAYEAGRVAIHAQWAQLASAQQGVLLVAVPATDVVLYASEATPEAVDALRTMAREVAKKNPTPVSPIILKWTPERWVAIP